MKRGKCFTVESGGQAEQVERLRRTFGGHKGSWDGVAVLVGKSSSFSKDGLYRH